MRTDSYSFGAFRYFIVPCEQMSLFDTVEEKRATAVNSFFSQLAEMKKRNWEVKGKKHLLVCNTKLSEDIFICKFSKETTKTIFKESDDDIENIDEPDYCPDKVKNQAAQEQYGVLASIRYQIIADKE